MMSFLLVGAVVSAFMVAFAMIYKSDK